MMRVPRGDLRDMPILFQRFSRHPSARAGCGVEAENLGSRRSTMPKKRRIVFRHEIDANLFELVCGVAEINSESASERTGKWRRGLWGKIRIGSASAYRRIDARC